MDATHDPFAEIDELLRSTAPAEQRERLLARLREPRFLPYLFEYLNMQGRRELGFHMQVDPRARSGAAEPAAQDEEYFVSACRLVGDEFVTAGDPAAAWPYYRAAGLADRMREAIEGFRYAGTPGDLVARQRLDGIIQVAFTEGGHPIRGYELILEHRGTCDGITAFERQFSHAHEIREQCGLLLVRQMMRDLRAGIRRAIELEEGRPPVDDPREPLERLLEGRPWLFKRGRPHVDDSHLQSVIRIASTLETPEALESAIELCHYGTHLGPADQRVEQPPFQDFYRDYRIFLGALLGRDADAAAELFGRKAEEAGAGRDGSWFAAQILVLLLFRLRRYREAVAAYLRFLGGARQIKVAPSLIRLCELAGDPQSLVEFARRRQDLVQLCAAHILATTPWPRADR